jgi:hypothetical protein
MVSIEVIALVLTGLSITASIVYYTSTLRNTSKSQQIQMLQRLHDSKYDVEGLKNYFELMSLKWENFDDFFQRYGGRMHPEMAAKHESQTSYFEGLGVLVKNNVIDVESVYEITGNRIISFWFRFETIIKGFRQGVGFGPGDDYAVNFEYLANEMIRIRKEKGANFPIHDLHPTSTLIKEYNP